jgi:O-acetyl-ADP-ribose deacetylase (regulator of RNase III)
MIRMMRGDLIKDSADVLVNPVNTVGVMGKGLALQFKRAFPNNYDQYRRARGSGELQTGMVFAAPVADGRWIVNFPTKRHWRHPSKLSYIEDGLDALVAFIARERAESVAIPRLGCGNGGLPWDQVRLLIETKLTDAPVEVRLYEPG